MVLRTARAGIIRAKYLVKFVHNPLTPTVAIWEQLWSILCQTEFSRHLSFLTSGHSGAQSWESECPDVKTYKQRLNSVWHRMLYSCSHMATVGVKGISICVRVCPRQAARSCLRRAPFWITGTLAEIALEVHRIWIRIRPDPNSLDPVNRIHYHVVLPITVSMHCVLSPNVRKV